jgi:threonine synthase
MDALQRGFDTITVATCGNYGVAFALAAGFAGLRCRIYIPQEYHTNRIKEMTHLGAEIVQAYLIKSENCEDLNPGKIRQTSVNEPLINWRSIDGNLALEAIRQTGGWAANASDKAMYKYTSLIRQKEGLQVLPASTAGLIALMTHHKKEPLSSDRFVVVLTGRKS